LNYPEECKYCKKYTLPDKFCCKQAFEDRTDDSVLIIPEEIHYNTEEIVYVPVFQVNFDEDGNKRYSSFVYSYSDATTDEQMAWACGPDYVFVLKGTFDAKTKPYIIKDEHELNERRFK